jgi:hypothetical protein
MRFPESIVRKMYAVSNRLKLLANLTASRRCISASFVMYVHHTRITVKSESQFGGTMQLH